LFVAIMVYKIKNPTWWGFLKWVYVYELHYRLCSTRITSPCSQQQQQFVYVKAWFITDVLKTNINRFV
jgi:hypothetical protein